MNNAKHTPGPWVAEESDGNLAKVSYTGTGLRSVIARLHENSLCNEHTGSVNANANLIAAAPAMYEALKMARWLSNGCECHESWNAPEGNLCGHCTADLAIKTALSQAEGRQHTP